MFDTDDLLEVLGGDHQTKMIRDRVVGEAASIKYNDIDSLKKLFPDEPFSDTQSVAYMASKMCHSYPKVNARKRTFFPKVIANSVASARDNFVNIDHMVSDNGLTNEEAIIGHIKAASFQWEESNDLPTKPIPMHALTALYLRMPVVRNILSESRIKKNWLTSMECGHDIRKSGFWYENEFIPMADAPDDMRECIKPNTVLPYRGKELAFCLGGQDGSVDFWGYAATESPADSDASILGIATYGREVFDNGKKKKFFGFRFQNYTIKDKTAEAANIAVDTRMNEQASISVIGKTEPTEDGHAHDVLSDGTIVPYDGHTHYIACYNLTRGTNPSFTGRTEAYTMYNSCSSCNSCSPCGCSPSNTPHVHMHMINISLKGKTPASKNADDVSVVPEVSNFSESDMLNLQAIADSVAKLEKHVSTGKPEANVELIKEFANLKDQIAKSNFDATIKDAVKAELASLEKDGKILTKEKADEAVKAAEDKIRAELELVAKQNEIRQRRRDELTALGVQLDTKDYEPAVGKTLREYVDSFTTDDMGEKLFAAEVRTIKTMKQLEDATKVTPASVAAPVTPAVPAEKPLAEAANVKKGIFGIVGAHAPKEKELAGVANGDGKSKLFAGR